MENVSSNYPHFQANGELSKASIDISIHWKFAYTFDDGHLEVEAPTKVATKPKGMYEAAKKDVPTEPPIRKLILTPETETAPTLSEEKEAVATAKEASVLVSTIAYSYGLYLNLQAAEIAGVAPIAAPPSAVQDIGKAKPVIREVEEQQNLSVPTSKVIFAASNSSSEMSLSPPSSAERERRDEAATRPRVLHQPLVAYFVQLR